MINFFYLFFKGIELRKEFFYFGDGMWKYWFGGFFEKELYKDYWEWVLGILVIDVGSCLCDLWGRYYL